jgi:hypothetical protein
VNRAGGDQEKFGDIPWASVFDPATNARALSAIQAEGFRAASELVDRFVRFASTGLSGSQPSPTPTGHPMNGDHSADVPAADFERLLQSWLSLTEQFLRGSGQVADATSADSVAFDLTNTEAKGSLNLEAAAPGCARGEVWLHNTGPGDLGHVRLRCSDLLAHDGSSISLGAISFDPDVVPLPPRSSRGVGVRINMPQQVSPGRYSGTLLAEGFPDLSLPVVLTVRSSAP